MRLFAAALAIIFAHAISPEPVRADDGDTDRDAWLDEVPNYAEALRGQWRSADIAPMVREMLADTAHYGRLRPAPARELALDDCIALALANNTELQIARLGPLGARAEIRRAQSVFDPAFTAAGSRAYSVRPAGSALQGAITSRNDNIDYSLGVGKLLTSGGQVSLAWTNNRLETNSAFLGLRPQYTSELLLSLNQPLLRDFGRRFATLQVRIARVAESGAVRQYEGALADLIGRVETAYWAVVGTAENVKAQEQGVLAARELLRQNEGKFAVGTVPRTAVLEAQAEVARREADLIQAQNAQSLAVDTLRAVINAPAEDAALLVNVVPSDEPTVEPLEIDLDASLALAIENRPEIAAARLELERQAMQLKLAENQLLPRLDAVGSVGTNGLSGKNNPSGLSVPGSDPNSVPGESPFAGPVSDSWRDLYDGRFYDYGVGLTLEIPLDNAAARADYQLSRVNLERARLDLRRLEENVTLEVKRAATNLETDLKSIQARRIARELAEENVRNQQARYDVGLATTKDLLDFQDQLTQARAAEIRALTQYLIDLAELRRVEGTLLEARNVDVDAPEPADTPWWAMFCRRRGGSPSSRARQRVILELLAQGELLDLAGRRVGNRVDEDDVVR